MRKEYPQNPDEWQSSIQRGIGLNKAAGQLAYHGEAFPYKELENWIKDTFSQGYHPDFVPALLRNIKGLVGWVYGDREEPSWSGSDSKVNGSIPRSD
jgi:hypothetical protein